MFNFIFFEFVYYFVLCVRVLCLHVCPFTTHVQCLWRSENAINPLDIEVKRVVSCHVCTGHGTLVLQEQPMLLTVESSL